MAITHNEIEEYGRYKATINYHRTDDIKEGNPKNGEEVIVQVAWQAEEGEKFAGQWIFQIDGYPYWVPECDLIITEVSHTPKMHVQQLSVSLPEKVTALKEVFIEITGENPWKD